MIDTLNDHVGEIQPLHKVLPAGVPLVATHWTCPTCGLTVRGCPPRACMDDCNPNCPVDAL